MYRPKGFNSEVIARENLPSFKWGTQEFLHIIHGIDIGADAMLEALKKDNGTHFEAGEWTDDATFETAKPGTVVFIPDEQRDGAAEAEWYQYHYNEK